MIDNAFFPSVFINGKSLNLGELPDKMSASEGEEGLWKSGRRKGGCVNLMLQISFKCGLGGGGKKSKTFADVSNGSSPIAGNLC